MFNQVKIMGKHNRKYHSGRQIQSRKNSFKFQVNAPVCPDTWGSGVSSDSFLKTEINMRDISDLYPYSPNECTAYSFSLYFSSCGGDPNVPQTTSAAITKKTFNHELTQDLLFMLCGSTVQILLT